ncbi:MAG: sodium:solute symporter family protein [Calditrichaeota bacterium]|nr:MAG: sodium:solute symporter family protein [Calditrichota bacterium]MBL1207110.1 sodium:solute symporter family protein [Calditrichota bacterium]NOG46940.1 sodium:solute symporter family protein [Calditrichota bacterium]
MTNTFIYWTGFLTYSFIVLWIGFSVWKKSKGKSDQNDTKEFWSANKSLSSWSVGLSISASMMSISWSCVYGVQIFYWYGLGGAWLLIIPWLLTMAGFYFLVPLFRKFNTFSQPELLEKRFGKNSRILLAPALIIVFITWTGGEIFAAGNIIAPFLGISPQLTFLLIAVVVATYSFSGGFEAVISTDKIQFILVALFISIIAYLGWNAIPENAVSITPPKSVSHDSNIFSPGAALIFMTFFAYLPGWLIETDLWVRIQAAKSNKAAKKGILIAGFNSLVFVGIMPLVIGLSALALFPPVDGIIPEQIKDGALIFTEIMKNYSPIWLNLLLSVGLIAAAMSTIDTCGNIVALSFSKDLIEPKLKNRFTPAQIQKFARFSSVLAIFAGYIYALFTDNLWDIFYLSSGILTTTVFIPVLASFFKSVSRLEINISIFTGLIFTLLFYFLEKNQLLSHIQPDVISETGLGYIAWAFLLTLLSFIAAYTFDKRNRT